jgi:D-alanine transaminase
MRIAYVNGAYVPHAQAAVHIEDRGYQFADGVYEVVCLVKGRLIDFAEHLDRLDYSLSELQIPAVFERSALEHICHEVIRLNRLKDGVLYIQITRGVAPRYHAFPKHIEPSIVVTARYFNQAQAVKKGEKGVAAITMPDNRWARPDIKSISLLPNVLAKQQAVDVGAYESILYNKDKVVTEANSANVWIVDNKGVLRTSPLLGNILAGITRQRLIQLLGSAGITVEESLITLDELRQAQEIILTASTSAVTPIIMLDNQPVGQGTTGEMAKKMSRLYLDYTGG